MFLCRAAMSSAIVRATAAAMIEPSRRSFETLSSFSAEIESTATSTGLM